MDYQETTSNDLGYICAVYEEALRRRWDADYGGLHGETAQWRVQVFCCSLSEFIDIMDAAKRIAKAPISFPAAPNHSSEHNNTPHMESNHDL